MSTYRNLEQQQQAVEAAKVTNAERLTCIHVFQKWPTLVVCEANEKGILDIINRWTGNNPDVLPSIQIFEEVIAENPAEFNTLAKQTEDVTRRQLTDSIIELLATKGKAHDDFSLKSERTRLKTFTIPMLRARLADLQTKAHMAGQSMQQLKQVVAAARPVPGFPMLPKQLFENGATVIVNATYLKALDAFSLKRLCRIYSVEAVNSRLAEGQ
jgi:hypothetical protein